MGTKLGEGKKDLVHDKPPACQWLVRHTHTHTHTPFSRLVSTLTSVLVVAVAGLILVSWMCIQRVNVEHVSDEHAPCRVSMRGRNSDSEKNVRFHPQPFRGGPQHLRPILRVWVGGYGEADHVPGRSSPPPVKGISPVAATAKFSTQFERIKGIVSKHVGRESYSPLADQETECKSSNFESTRCGVNNFVKICRTLHLE